MCVYMYLYACVCRYVFICMCVCVRLCVYEFAKRVQMILCLSWSCMTTLHLIYLFID